MRIAVATVALGLTSPVLVTAQPHERPAERRAFDVLHPDVATGANYRVQDPVLADGYMYRFQIDSSFGAFDLTGAEGSARASRRDRSRGDGHTLTLTEASPLLM